MHRHSARPDRHPISCLARIEHVAFGVKAIAEGNAQIVFVFTSRIFRSWFAAGLPGRNADFASRTVRW